MFSAEGRLVGKKEKKNNCKKDNMEFNMKANIVRIHHMRDNMQRLTLQGHRVIPESDG